MISVPSLAIKCVVLELGGMSHRRGRCEVCAVWNEGTSKRRFDE
jgi:hypothetical protein